jgi:HTTM domain
MASQLVGSKVRVRHVRPHYPSLAFNGRKRPEPALSLAALRVVAPALLLATHEFWAAPAVAAWQRARWVVPEGLHWFVAWVPIAPRWAIAAQVVTAFCALCAIVGVRARLALAGLTLSAFYVYAISELTGWAWHDMHLLWFSALLAASPCDDVLALDATRPLLVASRRYATPLWAARALLAAIYFFPGLHKLLTSGVGWALSDNLRNQMWWKWAEHGALPARRIDHVPWLLHSAGLFVLAFELSFPLLVLFRRTRPVAAAAGVIFHELSRAIFLIPFESLWLCYVVLVDLRPVVRRLPRLGARLAPPSVAPDASPRRARWAPAVVGSLLFCGAAVQGGRGQMQSFPFACYPTFQWRAGTRLPDLIVTATFADGREQRLLPARAADWHHTQRQWGEVWALTGVTRPVSATRLVAYWKELIRVPEIRRRVAGANSVRFYRVERSVVPEHWRDPPLSKTLLVELRARPAVTR